MPPSTASAPRIEPVQLMLAHELVLEQLRTALALGRFRAGDTLPRERDLAEMLQVSRPPVREALAVLASEGVIEIRRGRGGGLFVTGRPADEASKVKLLRENRERLRETFEYRIVIESAAARYAAHRRTRSELAELRHMVTEMQRLSDLLAERHDATLLGDFLAVDNDFHLGIARASRNDWLAKATLAARIEMFRPVGSIFDRLEPQANHLHEQIVTAVADKDGDGAARWMSEHIGETLASIESWLQPRSRARREPAVGRRARPGASAGADGLPADP
jgi:GntR family transcriptional regulator, transcriptional repressor for pyruvate dehydrogenase complex